MSEQAVDQKQPPEVEEDDVAAQAALAAEDDAISKPVTVLKNAYRGTSNG